MPHPRQYARQPAGGVSTTAGPFHCLVLSGSVLVLGGDLRACEHLRPLSPRCLGRPACLPSVLPRLTQSLLVALVTPIQTHGFFLGPEIPPF